MESRNTFGTESDQGVAQPNRDEEPERAAKDSHHKTFDQKLANDLCARRANGGMNSEFPGPRGAASGKQIGKIGAGDEQDQSHRTEEQSQISPVFAHEIFEQWSDHRVLFSVRVRVSFLQTSGDRFHLRARLIDSHAGLELAPDVDHWVMGTIHPCRVVAAPHHRQPEIRVLRRHHLRWHYADDGEILIVQIDRPTDYLAIAIERTLPETIANHDNRGRADFIFVLAKSSAKLRRQPDDVEKIPSD